MATRGDTTDSSSTGAARSSPDGATRRSAAKTKSDETRWLLPDEARAWRAWLAMSDLLHSQLARDLLADSGLSYADYQVLVQLSEAAEHRVRMSDLALRLDWSKSRVSHQVTRMEARGLLIRQECPSDARGAFAVLTSAGMDEIRRAAPGHVDSVRTHFVDLLDADQLRHLTSISERVLEHLRTLPEGAAALSGLCPDHPAE